MVLTAQRLILRHSRDRDRSPFAETNASARVMEFFPATMGRAKSEAQAKRIEAHFAAHAR
jgi:hypothetical protein